MLAVSFFFVLAGVVLLFAGLMGLFLLKLTGSKKGQTQPQTQPKKWVISAMAGLVCMLLGMLMAMT